MARSRTVATQVHRCWRILGERSIVSLPMALHGVYRPSGALEALAAERHHAVQTGKPGAIII
jgi:hypothetical protein